MGIAANLQRQSRGKPGIGLPQLHPGLLRQRHQLIPRPLIKPGVRGIRNILLHHRRIHRHALHAALANGTGFLPGTDRLGEQPFDPLFPDATTPTGQRGRIYGQLVLEEGLTGEVLVIRVLDPAGHNRLIRQPVSVLQIKQPRHQPRRRRRPPLARRKELRPFPLEHLPIDQACQLHQLVPRVDQIDQPRTQQIILFWWARAMLHGWDQNCRVLNEIIRNPARRGEKKHSVS